MARPKKTIRFKIREHSNASGNTSYRVIGNKVNGERIRRNFPTRLEAEQERTDLEIEAAGQMAPTQLKRTRLTDEQLADAEAAIKTADGRRISKIVSHYLSLENRLKSRHIGIDAAVSFTESHYREELVAVSIFNSKSEFLQSRAGKSPRTKQFYETSLQLLLKPDPNKELSAFTITDLEKILNRYTNVNTKHSYRNAINVFFNWAVRHRYCLENPCDRLDQMPRDMSRIATLSMDESIRLLYAATQLYDGATASCIAIGIFAGLRPSEINDLKPEDVLKNKIRVSGGKMRRKLKRTVPIPPVLAAWLRKYPFQGSPKGLIYKMKALKRATKAKKWVQDIIRHTAITFQTERDKNEALTAYNCGTSIQMMNRHYRDTIDDENMIKEFWSLTPAKVIAKAPDIKLPATQHTIEWPTTTQLKKLVWQKPMVHVAADLGISDVAVKKRCVKLGIELPPRGHWLK